MNTLAYESLSLWSDTSETPKFPSLEADTQVDVCIVGGGIAGLTTAYLLMKEGKSVCVLEMGEIGCGQTGKTTAQFSNVLDNRYFDIEKYHGVKGARLAAQSHREAIEKVVAIVQKENINCDLERVPGYLYSEGDPRKNTLQKELHACHRAELRNVEWQKSLPLENLAGVPCLLFADQMQLHPLKYLNSLAQIIIAGGGSIYTRTHATQMTGGESAFVEVAGGHTVHCQAIVVATNSPVNDLVAIHTKQAAYRSYVMGFSVSKGSYPRAFFWDTLDPYHYVRLQNSSNENEDILVVGGSDHKTGQESNPEECFANLEVWARKTFPLIETTQYKWSGQVIETMDGLAFLGRNPLDKNNVFVITGDSGSGMTHCTIGALLITDLIMERDNPWTQLYSPSRIKARALPEFIRENANVAAQYADWIVPLERAEFKDLPRGEGKVFRHDLLPVAIYKEENDVVKFLSAVCPHLAGVVRWNNVEKSWDCPCHGSRFDCHGKVIEGPANSDLEVFVDEKAVAGEENNFRPFTENLEDFSG